jgi:hypothetical protein
VGVVGWGACGRNLAFGWLGASAMASAVSVGHGDGPVYERAHPVALLVGRGDKVRDAHKVVPKSNRLIASPTHPRPPSTAQAQAQRYKPQPAQSPRSPSRSLVIHTPIRFVVLRRVWYSAQTCTFTNHTHHKMCGAQSEMCRSKVLGVCVGVWVWVCPEWRGWCSTKE